ncbi:hypothetical protein [Actinospica robiniae]|uniref:hypothetical protein n=1 Tax=Actinospica robiniae TaxID=304901 RepID=UPI00040FB9E7|nr:hypothetical protein [Actinospica robiniae]
MGHGIDFGEELAVNHRHIRQAAAAAPGHPGRLCAELRQHTELMRRHVLPALAANVDGGTQIAAADESLIDRIQAEVGGAGPCEIPRLAPLLDEIEVQLRWEDRVLLPLLEAATTWLVLEDLADHARLARQRVTCEPA